LDHLPQTNTSGSPRLLPNPFLEASDGLGGYAPPRFSSAGEAESKELPLPRSGHGAFRLIDLELETVRDEARNALHHSLSRSFAVDVDVTVSLDPDEEVRGAVALLFRLFRETGSAFAVVQRFSERGLRFPKRAYGGAWNGKLIWGRLTHSRVLGILKNPSYTGMYVFGRFQYRVHINAQGEVRKQMRAVAMPDWRVRLPEHHEGYITKEEFFANLERLQKNRTNGEATVLSGPAREGLALLQGLLLCGNCGRALTVRYQGNGGIYPTYLCNWLHHQALATKDCMSFRCDVLDSAIADEVFKVLQPAELELALGALRELETRDQAMMRQWQMRVERAEYEAALAERRYEEVDPSNRLVASTLERRWNEALLQIEDLKKQAAEFQQQKARVMTAEQKEKVLAMARDLPRLWHSPSTQAKDRKRMLRMMIKDITVEKSAAPKQLLVHIRWQGGACSERTVQLPLNMPDRVRYPAAIVERVRELAQSLPDSEIAAQLNRDGRTSAKGKPYSIEIIRWIRWRHQISPATLKAPEELTVQQVAQQFGVSTWVVYYWIEHGIITTARRLKDGMPYWITLKPADEEKLRDWVRSSSKIPKVSQA